MNSKINPKAILLSQINFGDIDGLYDKNINDYFIDIQYKEALLKEDKFFVIGRKGTGKSALYNWLFTNQVSDGIMVSNKSFSDFPFEKLLRLSDDDFSRPNQYQSIWKHIIFSELARMIVEDESNNADDEWSELKDYISFVFGSNLVDLHKEVTRKVTKRESRLGYDSSFLGHGSSDEIEHRFSFDNITNLNASLWRILTSYLKRNQTKQYIIQFDQLDDNYTTYINNDSYLQCVIGLFKSVYQIDQSFKRDDIPVKIVAYLRSDIYNQFNHLDPESSRWDQYVLKLNWAIINKNDWADCNLLKLVNARIRNSLPDIISDNPFSLIFNKYKIALRDGSRKNADIFRYIVHRTFQRPRDLIQFCIKIQEESKSTGSLDAATIRNAEKEYSLWLLGELENEIAPVIKDTESLYELLRLFGRSPYTLSAFRLKFAEYSSCFGGLDAEEMLRILYNFGIIINVRTVNNRIIEQFSVLRNDRSVFNRDLNIRTHPGFYEGLHTSKFLTR